MNQFIKPDFSEKSLELRYEKGEISIYGTEEGLKRFSELIRGLIEKPKQGHIHLENYNILTKTSLIAAIGIFDKEGNTL